MARELFRRVRHRDYITLYFLGEFKGNFDNDQEVNDEIEHILYGN